MAAAKAFSMLCLLFFVVIFVLPFCSGGWHDVYGFSQDRKSVIVCKKHCEDGTAEIFHGKKSYGTGMTLGFLNLPSAKFHDDYDMAKYGFPIFYEYGEDLQHDYVNFIIANGKLDEEEDERGQYFYVQLKKFNQHCKSFPVGLPATGNGALYLNQRYATFGYYIYQSPTSTCILTFKFEDLLRGDFTSNEPIEISPQKVDVIDNKIPDFIHFTIDPIFGTMVYLAEQDDKYYVIHLKIDENNLNNNEEVFRFELNDETSDGLRHHIMDPGSKVKNLPFFSSYGKFASLFYQKGGSRFVAVFSPEDEELDETDDHRRAFYILGEELFENGEPVGRYTGQLPHSEPTTPSSTSSSKAVSSSLEPPFSGPPKPHPSKPESDPPSNPASASSSHSSSSTSCHLTTTPYFWEFIAFLVLAVGSAAILGTLILLTFLGRRKLKKNAGKKSKPKKGKKKKPAPPQAKKITQTADCTRTSTTAGGTQATTKGDTTTTQTSAYKTTEKSGASPSAAAGATQKTTAFKTGK